MYLSHTTHHFTPTNPTIQTQPHNYTTYTTHLHSYTLHTTHTPLTTHHTTHHTPYTPHPIHHTHHTHPYTLFTLHITHRIIHTTKFSQLKGYLFTALPALMDLFIVLSLVFRRGISFLIPSEIRILILDLATKFNFWPKSNYPNPTSRKILIFDLKRKNIYSTFRFLALQYFEGTENIYRFVVGNFLCRGTMVNISPTP
jgi:hypothetical protein